MSVYNYLKTIKINEVANMTHKYIVFNTSNTHSVGSHSYFSPIIYKEKSFDTFRSSKLDWSKWMVIQFLLTNKSLDHRMPFVCGKK